MTPPKFGDMTLADNEVLVMCLALAVPMRIEQLLAKPDRDRVQRWWARRAADAIASDSADLIYSTKLEKGTAAKTFNRLAEGIAALALCPGGVLFAGTHWCVDHAGGLSCTDPEELDCAGRAPERAPTDRERRRDALVVLSERLNAPIQTALFGEEAS